MSKRFSRTAVAVACCLAGGCVGQTMTVTSDPSGALVYMNDREVGRTPLTREFTWYGAYDVQVRKEGYQTLRTTSTVIAPWWNWMPFDLVANVLPLHFKDEQKLHYAMAPERGVEDAGALIGRAGALRKQLEKKSQ